MKTSVQLTVSETSSSIADISRCSWKARAPRFKATGDRLRSQVEVRNAFGARFATVQFGIVIGIICVLELGSASAQTADASPKSSQEATTAGDSNDLGTGYPRLDDPWTFGKPAIKKAKAEPTPEPPAQQSGAQSPAPETSTAGPTAEASAPLQPRIRKNEISASGDFFLGQGNVTMPFGFSLREGFGFASTNVIKSVAKPDRTSDYFGGTISYSHGQAWYVDLAYANGTSSGNADVVLGSPPTLNSAFTIKDNWYQAYIRYAFPGLHGKRLSAYLRAGVSYVQAELTDETTIPALGLYHQTDKTDDLLGNLGFGVGYLLYPGQHVRVGLQLEGEGFYGRRSQKSTESLADALFTFPTASIDNNLYGGIGRATVQFQYRVGQSGAFKIFADGGLQGKFTMISYSAGLGTFNELLWGPYIKVGLRFSF